MPPGEALLDKLRRAGGAEFPAVRLDDADLARFVATREIPADLSDERAAEVFVACACARGSSPAIAAVKERYFPRVSASLGRGRSPEAVEEALQQMMATIFVPRDGGKEPEIGDFAGAGPLGAWLRMVALRILIRHERKHKRAAEIGRSSSKEAVPVPDSPELAYLRRKYSAALQDALMEAWQGIAADLQVLLRLRYTDGRGIDDIAAVENIHRATAARRLRKAEESLVEEARRILAAKLGASEPDVNSVLRLLRSQLEISAGRIFGKPSG